MTSTSAAFNNPPPLVLSNTAATSYAPTRHFR